MGIFNFFKPKKNDSEIIKKLFPNLKGIHFESISTTPKGDSPEKFFNSDIDGKWFFSVHNFAMIFKSFSDENYEKSLSELIDSNGIDLNSIKEESSHYYFEGDGFKIEKPKSPGLNLIIISNEDWTHTDVVKLKSFDQLNEVQVEWISGIDKIYEGEDALSRFNLSKDLKNVVMYFKEEDSDYLLIHIPTSNVAKSIINQIIDKNKKEDEFVKVNDEGEWQNLHENNNIVIGYLPKHQAVRINHKKSTNDIIEMSSDKVHYNNVKEKGGITYFQGEKYTGIVEYASGYTIAEFKDGKKINSKHLFRDGSIKTFSEIINGELIEIKGWIKIDSDGNYDENGTKVLVREYKNGREIKYYNNGNIQSESDVNRRRSTTEEDNTFTNITYYENGNIERKEVLTKYDETGNNGGVTVMDQSYYETGDLREEKVEDKKYPTKYITYHKDGSIKSICVSNTQYRHQGHKFEFDEDGNETTTRFEEDLKGEESIREYLNLGEFKGELKIKPKERKILTHEIMTKGVFSFELKNGDNINVFGQRHTLFCLTEIWDEESEEWMEEDREEIDEFHLTDYDKGYKFDESDLDGFFEIEEDDYPEWDFNGSSYDWSGIDDEDDYETREKKWYTYKNKFPNVSSKPQFKIN